MNRRARALVLFLAAALVVAGVAIFRVVRRPPTIASARLVMLPGAKERIAKFPELLRLAKADLRPAAPAPGLPFALDDSPKPAVTPTIERQTLLGAESFAPRPPRAIIAAYRGRADLADAERDALVDALLDTGQVDQAVAVRRARVAQVPDDETAHRALLEGLDGQNRVAEWLVANEAYFQMLLRRGRAAAAGKDRDAPVAAAGAALADRAAVARRALVATAGVEALRLTLVDAFPQDPKLLATIVSGLLAEKKSAQAQAILGPRLTRYTKNLAELWELAKEAYRLQGQPDRLLRLAEETLSQADDDEIFNIYGRLLEDANLADARRTQLLDALKSAPSAANLRSVAALDLARGRGDLARDELAANATRASADADPKALLRLSALATRAGLGGLAATWALDAALADDGKVETTTAAARIVAQAGDAAAWPTALSPAGAFAPAFADRGPGVVGGLLSLGINRLGGRAAMNNMPAVGGRYGNQRVAAQLALAAAEAAPDATACYEAAAVAAAILTKAELAEPLSRLADRLLARFGESQPAVGRILLWRADAAAIRHDVDGQVAALRRAAQTARAAGQEEAAATAQQRLEQLLLEKRRYPEVLALKWERVERFPQDETAMQELLDFVDDHRLFDDEARAYRTAIERFNRKNWTDKFARWLLREKRRADFESLTTNAAQQLGEGELADFLAAQFKEIAGGDAGDALFEKLYTIALQRFPANVVMNLRLLDCYERRGFAGARPQTDYQDKFLDLGLRCVALDRQIPDRVLRRLAQREMLRGMLAKLAQQRIVQPVEAYLWTRGQQFLANYEAARRGYAALAERWTGAIAITSAQATVARSLANSFYVRDPALAAEAAAVWDRQAVRRPLEIEPRTLQGEALLEGGRPRDAAAAWETIPAAAPGETSRWLELATLYWDYYLPAQARDALDEARKRVGDPELLATEMAYLLETEGRLDDALAELAVAATGDGYGRFEAGNHLRELIERGKTTAAAVDAAFWRGVTRPDATGEAALHYLQWLRDGDRLDDAKAAALKLLPRYDDVAFAEGVLAMFMEVGDEHGAEACLRRLVAIGKNDPAMLRRLAAFYENRGARTDADKTVAELLAFAQTDGARHDAWQYAADYYWRTERREAALTYHRRLAEEAGDAQRVVSLWIAYADRCLAAKHPDQALDAMAQLRRDRPTEPAIVGTMAKAYVAKGDRDGLVALYQTVLNDLKKADLGDAAKKAREAELRGKLIVALTDLGRFREALEEHMQIINRNAPDEEPVLAAYRYAKRRNQLAPLLAYYEREAERANRDYRWQFVTAALYEADGRYADAARLLDKAAANEPQRLDLLERRAAVLIKAGDFAGAVAVYRTLAARRLTGADYQMRVAEVLYLANQPAEAEAWLDRILAAADTEVGRATAAADLARRHGRAIAARKYAAQALNLVLAQPDKRTLDDAFLPAWLADQLETAGVAQAIAQLQAVRAQLEKALAATHPVGREPIRKTLAQLDGLTTGALADWLGDRADAATRQAAAPLYANMLDDAVKNAKKKNAAYDNAAAAARRAQLPELAAELLRRELTELAGQTANNDKGRPPAMALAALLRTRAATEPLAPLAAQAAGVSPALPAADDAVIETAALLRAAGEFAAEKQLLARVVGSRQRVTALAAPDAATARYFSLLDGATLDKLAESGACPQPGPLTVWLAQQGQTARLITALNKQFAAKGPRWLLAKRALAYQADPKFAADAKKAYAELLGLPLLIGSHAGVKPPPEQATDKLWTHFAFNYGEWLTTRGDEAGAPWLYAEPERQPLTPAAYLRVVAALDQAQRFAKADDFLARAEMLGGGEELLAAKARHLHAQGRDRQAADALASLVADPKTALAAAPRYAALMADIGRASDAVARWRGILNDRLPALASYQRVDAVGEFLAFAAKNVSPREAAAAARNALSASRLDSTDLRELIARDRVPAGAVVSTWLLALERLADDLRRYSVYVNRHVAEAALEYALTAKEENLARRAFAALAKYYPAEAPADVEETDAMRRQRVRAAALFDGERAAEALALGCVQGRVDDDFAAAIIEILRQAGMSTAADRVWLAFFEPIRRDEQLTARWLATVNEHESGSAEFDAGRKSLAAYLRLQNLPAARELTTELREMCGDSEQMLTSLATTLVENGAAGEALPLIDQAVALDGSAVAAASLRVVAYLAAGRVEAAATHLANGWRDGTYGQASLIDVVSRAAETAAAVAGTARRWESALAAAASPARELALAALALRESRGDKAAQALAALGEPLRYPMATWRMRARALRLTGDLVREQQALAELLRLDPADKAAARRLAWLELARTPFAGLLRLNHLGMPASPAQLADPLAATANSDALAAWWRVTPKAERAELALAVVNAWAAIDRPAAAAETGEAALATLGDDATAKLRARVAQQRQDTEKQRSARPLRFTPNDNLAQ